MFCGEQSATNKRTEGLRKLLRLKEGQLQHRVIHIIGVVLAVAAEAEMRPVDKRGDIIPGPRRTLPGGAARLVVKIEYKMCSV